MSLNKVTLIGNATADPKLSATQDGREIASFSLATNESWKDKNSGERREKVEFHRIVVFSQGLVGIIKNYVKKGSKLYIEGQLQTRKWTKDGVDHYTTEIVMQNYHSNLQLLGSKSESKPVSKDDGKFNEMYNNFETPEPFNETIDDEIPF